MRATNGAYTITTDYPVAPTAPAAGFTPMELLLASLAACTGSVVASLLRRLNQRVAGVEVEARGERRDEHPTVFTAIDLEFVVRGEGVEQAAIERAMAHADRLCPVLAMLTPGTPVRTSFRVVEEPNPSLAL
ncbi:MAG TPA: OsmC family protein [Vicinamibacterales bacterium]|nr:OsmC family protein [Vicinamibacterales bacterium]